MPKALGKTKGAQENKQLTLSKGTVAFVIVLKVLYYLMKSLFSSNSVH